MNQTHVDVASPLTQDDLWVIDKVFRCLVRSPEQEELTVDLFQRGEVLGNYTVKPLFKDAFIEGIAFLSQ